LATTILRLRKIFQGRDFALGHVIFEISAGVIFPRTPWLLAAWQIRN